MSYRSFAFGVSCRNMPHIAKHALKSTLLGAGDMAILTKTYIDKVQAPATSYEIHWDDRRGTGCVPPLRARECSWLRAHQRQGGLLHDWPIRAAHRTRGAREGAAHLSGYARGYRPARDVKKADEAAKVTLYQVADASSSTMPVGSTRSTTAPRSSCTTRSAR